MLNIFFHPKIKLQSLHWNKNLTTKFKRRISWWWNPWTPDSEPATKIRTNNIVGLLNCLNVFHPCWNFYRCSSAFQTEDNPQMKRLQTVVVVSGGTRKRARKRKDANHVFFPITNCKFFYEYYKFIYSHTMGTRKGVVWAPSPFSVCFRASKEGFEEGRKEAPRVS